MAETPAPEPLAYTVPTFCKAIGISLRTFYALLKSGEGPATVTIGRRRLVRREAGEAWLKSREQTAD